MRVPDLAVSRLRRVIRRRLLARRRPVGFCEAREEFGALLSERRGCRFLPRAFFLQRLEVLVLFLVHLFPRGFSVEAGLLRSLENGPRAKAETAMLEPAPLAPAVAVVRNA